MSEELKAYLDAIHRNACYRVERVLKEGEAASTELVYFTGANGSELGPFVRKRFARAAGLGCAYRRIWEAQQSGIRFVHVPRIIECLSTEDELVVVSEFVQGETLADLVYRCDPSVELAARVFPWLCDAVAELHEVFDPPLIHRDLKPSNVILSEGSVTLIDFGIARTYNDDAEADTHRFGTRAYAPPEQFGFGQTDVRSDVYALGMLLYYCLTEKTPDAAARKAEWRAQGVPEELRRVISRAGAFDPADRYASVAELRDAFSSALGLSSSQGERASMQADEGRGYPALSAMSEPTQAGSSRDEDRRPLGFVRDVVRSLKSFVRNVPAPLGAAWDVVLALVLIVLFGASLNSALRPLPGTPEAASPFWLVLLSYLFMFFLMLVPAAFLVCDRRPLYRVFGRLRDWSLMRQIGVTVVVMAVGFVLTGMTTVFFTPV